MSTSVSPAARPSWLDQTSTRLNQAATYLSVFFLVLLTGSSMLQVLSRNLTFLTLQWTEELSRFSYIWITLLGASVLSYHGSHAVLDSVSRLLRGRARKAHTVLIDVLTTVTVVLLGILSVELVVVTFPQVSSALELPMGLVYSAVTVASVIIVVHCLARIVRTLRGTESVMSSKEY